MNITVRVGDLGKVITGNTPPRSNPELYGNYIPFIKATDISENEKYTYTPEEYYSEEGFRKYKTSLIPKHSTCVVTIGSIGKKMTMACQDCFINQAMNAIIPNDDYDYEYVYYLLKNNIHKLKNLDSGTASGRENVSKSAFMGMELSVIKDKVTQKRIGSILSAYDDLIENNQKQIKLLEEAAQRLYKEWFVDLRFPGHEGVKVVDGVPKGWKKEKLIELAELKAGGDKPKIFSKIKSNICKVPIFANGLENEGLFGYTDKADIGQESITISARGNVGYTCLRRAPYLAIVRLICVIPRKMHISTYLYFYLKHTNYNSNGSAQQQLTIPMIKNTVVCVPDENMLSDFDDKARCYFDLVDALKSKISSLREARDRLLPKLMSGEIEV